MRRRPAALDGIYILSDHGCRVTLLGVPEINLAVGIMEHLLARLPPVKPPHMAWETLTSAR